MQHIHLDSTTSTQAHIKEHFPDTPRELLVSCEKQTNGVGRREKTWDAYLETLCFSATIDPHKNLTLTGLEIAVILKNFFKTEFKKELTLKWPNDLMREDKKCGGIILNNSNSDQLILGIGINIGEIDEIKNYPIPATSVFPTKIVFSKRNMAARIFSYILENRLTEDQVVAAWLNDCSHINKKVSLTDDQESIHGVFRGIGKNGQALIETSGELSEYYSGTLRITP